MASDRSSTGEPGWDRWLAALGPLLGAVLFGVALWLLHRELAHAALADVLARLRAIPRGDVGLALLWTVLDYLALTGYDALAFRFIRNPLPYRRIALGSFVAYVVSHNAGAGFIGGSAIRYRIFSSWGVSAAELKRVVLFNVGTFWLGFLAMAGLCLSRWPLPLPSFSWISLASSRPLGLALLALLVLALAGSAVPPPRRRAGQQLPGLSVVIAQTLLASFDWILAASVLYVLLPPSDELSFGRFAGAYLLSVLLGLASHVPAGLGVFETSMVVLLAPALSAQAVLGSIVAYRLLYYALPLSVAVGFLAAFEARQRRAALARGGELLGRWVPDVVPRLLALLTLAAGLILLYSGATPPLPERMRWLAGLLPLSVLELSHFAASVLGVALLFVARALLRRIDAAYALTLVLLAAGAVTSLLKGFDYEEAGLLALAFAALLPCRGCFDRRSSLFVHAFSPSWALAVAAVLAAVTFVTVLAYRNVEYSSELWWQFELSAHASRSLRALAGAGGLLAVYALARLLSPAAPPAALPSSAELERLAPIVAAAPRTMAHLALVGDKRLLVHERGCAFLMYGVRGRSWIAMGDPIGTPRERSELAWEFRALADRHGGRTAFYEVATEDLPLYVELGLSLHKLGEEARVPLAQFSLEGGARKSLRHAHRRLAREGCQMQVLPAHGVGAVLDELEALSNAWLAEKRSAEKRFSLGFFDRAYLQRLPLAVVRREGRITAFANLWLGAAQEELSIDLMRHRPDAAPGTMEYLFAELMLWGHAQGYRWFSLGMAPLSGFEQQRLSPLWNRLGALLFRHGEHFYGFQGLRQFKEKFGPVWEPRFLASDGGLSVPIALTHVAALISGGAARIVSR